MAQRLRALSLSHVSERRAILFSHFFKRSAVSIGFFQKRKSETRSTHDPVDDSFLPNHSFPFDDPISEISEATVLGLPFGVRAKVKTLCRMFIPPLIHALIRVDHAPRELRGSHTALSLSRERDSRVYKR